MFETSTSIFLFYFSILDNLKLAFALATVCLLHSAVARSGKAMSRVEDFSDDDDTTTCAAEVKAQTKPPTTTPSPPPPPPAQSKSLKVGHGSYPDDGTNISSTLMFVEVVSKSVKRGLFFFLIVRAYKDIFLSFHKLAFILYILLHVPSGILRVFFFMNLLPDVISCTIFFLLTQKLPRFFCIRS